MSLKNNIWCSAKLSGGREKRSKKKMKKEAGNKRGRKMGKKIVLPIIVSCSCDRALPSMILFTTRSTSTVNSHEPLGAVILLLSVETGKNTYGEYKMKI